MGDVNATRENILPYLTAITVLFCLFVISIDAVALYTVIQDNSPKFCQRNFTIILHIGQFLNVILFALCVVALVIGVVMMGLEESGISLDSNVKLFYGLRATD